MKDDIASRLMYWAFKFEGKGIQESEASDAMQAAALYIQSLREHSHTQAEVLTRERNEARAEVEALRAEVERLREENRILRASLKIDFEAALKRAEGDR